MNCIKPNKTYFLMSLMIPHIQDFLKYKILLMKSLVNLYIMEYRMVIVLSKLLPNNIYL